MIANPDESRPKSSEIRENAIFACGLILALLILFICYRVPLILAARFNPWCGILAAAGSLWVWNRFGPPSCRGLLSGFISVNGHIVIISSLLQCILLAVKYSFL